MKCFIHQNSDAIGVCKHCAKGLCAECFCDTGNGLTCQNTCKRAIRIQQYSIPTLSGFLAVFTFFGGVTIDFFSTFGIVMVLTSLGFASYTLWQLSVIRQRISEKKSTVSIDLGVHDKLEDEFQKLERK